MLHCNRRQENSKFEICNGMEIDLSICKYVPKPCVSLCIGKAESVVVSRLVKAGK